MAGGLSISGSSSCSPFASGISSSAHMTAVLPVALLSPTRSPRHFCKIPAVHLVNWQDAACTEGRRENLHHSSACQPFNGCK